MRLKDVENVLSQADAEGHEEVSKVLEAHLFAVSDGSGPEGLHRRFLFHNRLCGHQRAEIESGRDDERASLKDRGRDGTGGECLAQLMDPTILD